MTIHSKPLVQGASRVDHDDGQITILAPWRIDGLRAGFVGRRGGISTGACQSLNLSDAVGDDPACVSENWRRLDQAVGGDFKYARLVQVHGREVITVTDANAGLRPRADAMVTREGGIALSILTADCVPILLAAPREHVVAAAHAGWRGVIAGIAGESVLSMRALGAPPASICAALGPSIGFCCFEVDRDLADRFVAEMPCARRHLREGRSGKAYLDLRGIIRDQLIAAGLRPGSIESCGPCTRCAANDYFSRRAAHGVRTGLQMSFVGFDRD